MWQEESCLAVTICMLVPSGLLQISQFQARLNSVSTMVHIFVGTSNERVVPAGLDSSKFRSSPGLDGGILVGSGGYCKETFGAVPPFRHSSHEPSYYSDAERDDHRQYSPLLTDDEMELDLDAMQREV